jgi:hypothetical protein
MNTAEIERRETETFVIAKTDGGFRVCSPLTPATQYIVTGLPENPHCTCPEFARQEGDPEFVCSHILAVLHQAGEPTKLQPANQTAPNGSRGSDAPPAGTARKNGGGRNGHGAVMLLKRSVSPDGRIDSLSVEFSCPVASVTSGELRQQAEKILILQGEITAGFLKSNGNGKPAGNGNGDTNAIPAQLLSVGSMNGKWGRRLYLNVLVSGNVLKLFGNEKQLAQAVDATGVIGSADRLVDGYTLNLPCRVVTKPSPDGRYINIERVYPAQTGAPAKV